MSGAQTKKWSRKRAVCIDCGELFDARRSDARRCDRCRNPPPALQVTAARKATGLSGQLLTRHQIVALTGFTYPALWKKMRDGEFPRSRTVGAKAMWLSREIEDWITNLPRRRLKGDAPPDQKIEETA
jgi:predicted DNA-binding transcriptional regulator AlpA